MLKATEAVVKVADTIVKLKNINICLKSVIYVLKLIKYVFNFLQVMWIIQKYNNTKLFSISKKIISDKCFCTCFVHFRSLCVIVHIHKLNG